MLMAAAAAACSSGDSSGSSSGDAETQPGSESALHAAPATLTAVDCPEWLRAPDLSCGIATVPADPADEASGTVEISYVVVPGNRPDDFPPMAVLQGGPGAASSGLAAWAPRRPITQVFVDQRGSGFADADLNCHEYDDAFVESMGLGFAEAEEVLLERLAACAQRLGDTVLFEHAGTANHAADVIAVMAALGFEEWVVYGVSYGTTIALEALRAAPPGMIAAVLDGVYPPDVHPEDSIAAAGPASLAAAGAACQADEWCHLVDPDLPATVERLIARFDESPQTLHFDHSDTPLGEPLSVVVDGTRLAWFTFSALYNEFLAKGAAEMLSAIDGGSEDALWDFVALSVSLASQQAEDLSEAAYFAVECAERLPLAEDGAGGGVDRASLDAFTAAVLDMPLERSCEVWDRPAASAPSGTPVRSDLPVLLLSGGLDPITPESLARRAAETLSDATLVTLGDASHGIWFGDGCIGSIVNDFVSDPHADLDTSCAADR